MNVEVIAAIAVPLTSIVISAYDVPKKVKPLVALVLSVLISFLFGVTTENVILGLKAGIMAAGMYSVLTVYTKKKEENMAELG